MRSGAEVEKNGKRKIKEKKHRGLNAPRKQAGVPEITTKKKKAEGAGKKARELPPLDWPEGRRNLATVKTLTIRGDSNSVVVWMHGETRQNKHKKTIGAAQKDLLALCNEEWRLDDRNEGWARHVCREHNKTADSWAGRGMNGEHVLWETQETVEERAVESLWILGRELQRRTLWCGPVDLW